MSTKVNGNNVNLGLHLMITMVIISHMKTDTVLEFFGGGRGAKARTAKALGISRAAVSKWGMQVPASSTYKLFCIYPELFTLALAESEALSTEVDQAAHVFGLGQTDIHPGS